MFFEPVPIPWKTHTLEGDFDMAMSDKPYCDCKKSHVSQTTGLEICVERIRKDKNGVSR